MRYALPGLNIIYRILLLSVGRVLNWILPIGLEQKIFLSLMQSFTFNKYEYTMVLYNHIILLLCFRMDQTCL